MPDQETFAKTDDASLKERLIPIDQDDGRLDDEREAWPLVLQMMDHLGSTDPELRDELIYAVLRRWSESLLDTRQLTELLSIALDERHLFHGLGERESDSVFMRSFSSLVVALVVAQHRARHFLSAPTVAGTQRRMVTYLARERDLRGFVAVKGWAHAVAHAADALDELALCEELGEPELLEILDVVRQTVATADVVFVDDEDERLVTAVMSAAGRDVLTRDDLARWLAGFVTLEQLPTRREWARRRTNLTHVLRSLYFRARYEDAADRFEPALSETLRDVSLAGYPGGSQP